MTGSGRKRSYRYLLGGTAAVPSTLPKIRQSAHGPGAVISELPHFGFSSAKLVLGDEWKRPDVPGLFSESRINGSVERDLPGPFVPAIQSDKSASLTRLD